MIGMMTVTLRRAGMNWKEDSLAYVLFGQTYTCGDLPLLCPLSPASCAISGGEELPDHMRSTVVMPRREEVEALGVKLSSELKGYH
eukprot:4719771-Pyramimonas_sp.AAC.1